MMPCFAEGRIARNPVSHEKGDKSEGLNPSDGMRRAYLSHTTWCEGFRAVKRPRLALCRAHIEHRVAFASLCGSGKRAQDACSRLLIALRLRYNGQVLKIRCCYGSCGGIAEPFRFRLLTSALKPASPVSSQRPVAMQYGKSGIISRLSTRGRACQSPPILSPRLFTM